MKNDLVVINQRIEILFCNGCNQEPVFQYRSGVASLYCDNCHWGKYSTISVRHAIELWNDCFGKRETFKSEYFIEIDVFKDMSQHTADGLAGEMSNEIDRRLLSQAIDKVNVISEKNETRVW